MIGTCFRSSGRICMAGFELTVLKFEPTAPEHSVQPDFLSLLICRAALTSSLRKYGVTFVRSGGQFIPQLG